jgi:glucans biosynthesis protein C
MAALERRHDLDWLRVFGIAAVFLFHSNHFFDHIGWEVKAPDHYLLSTLITAFMNYWLMPLFFLVAGAGAVFALRKRDAWTFVRERAGRLLLPFLILAPILTPPQHYVEALQKGRFSGTFGEFLAGYFPRVWLDPWALRSPDWFGHVGLHLWFLGTLFLIAVVTAPVLTLARRPAVALGLRALAGRLTGAWGAVVFALLLGVERAALRPLWPGYNRWADFVFWATVFLAGAAIAADDHLLDHARRRWGWLAALAMLLFPSILLFNAFGDFGHYLDAPDWRWDSLLFHLLWGAMTAVSVLALAGFARRHRSAPSARVQALAPHTMAFYAVHQAPLLLIGYAVVGWDLPAPVRFLIIAGSALAVTVAAVWAFAVVARALRGRSRPAPVTAG